MTPLRKNVVDEDALGLRPLTARSVLLSTLLGADAKFLTARRLVATAGLFGIGEGAARVALSRMVVAGELMADDGRYALGERLRMRQRHQRADRRVPTARWRGGWHLAVVVSGARAPGARVALRRALERGHLAAWREGVWIRPDNLPRPELPADAAESVQWAGARVEAEPRALVASLWDLPAWATTATALTARLDSTAGSIAADDDAVLAPGFVLSAAVLRHLARDPLLPPSLLPPEWPGERLRATYDDWDRDYQRLLVRYQRSRT